MQSQLGIMIHKNLNFDIKNNGIEYIAIKWQKKNPIVVIKFLRTKNIGKSKFYRKKSNKAINNQYFTGKKVDNGKFIFNYYRGKIPMIRNGKQMELQTPGMFGS